MCKPICVSYSVLALARITGLVIVTLLSQSQQLVAQRSRVQDNLKRFLQAYDEKAACAAHEATRYSHVFVDLNNDSEDEVIVRLTGRCWCGSGGCRTLVLAHDSDSYRVITEISIARPPIRLLTTASNGWRDLGVWVQGGGVQPGYEAALRFDGSTYPRNPSTVRGPRAGRGATGEILIPSSRGGTPLHR